jgi:hypothetical protein
MGSPLTVCDPRKPQPIFDAYILAAIDYGYKLHNNFNGPGQEGLVGNNLLPGMAGVVAQPLKIEITFY